MPTRDHGSSYARSPLLVARRTSFRRGPALPAYRRCRRVYAAANPEHPRPFPTATRRAARRPAGGGGRGARRAWGGAFVGPSGGGAAGLAGGAGLSGEGRAARFAVGPYGLAEVAAEHGGLPALLRGEDALAALEAACR